METQLVRLDAPYNVIFDYKREKFGLHIATLIVVDEVTEGRGKNAKTKLRSRSYPVVNTAFDLEGNAWTDSELQNCFRLCRQNETVSLYEFKRFMNYCDANGVEHLYRIPMLFNIAMMSYDIKFNLHDISTGKKISDFKIELLFDEEEKQMLKYYSISSISDINSPVSKRICLVHSAPHSPFYFWSDLSMDDGKFDDTIQELAKLRDTYLHAFKFEGLKSITFTTENEKYQDFVDLLNNTQSE